MRASAAKAATTASAARPACHRPRRWAAASGASDGAPTCASASPSGLVARNRGSTTRSATGQATASSSTPRLAVNHQLPSGFSGASGASSRAAPWVMPSSSASNWPGSRFAAKAPEMPA